MSATRAVLFDLDGTLADTAPDLGGAANFIRESLGLEPLPIPAYRQHASAGARGMLQTALGITPDHKDYPDHRARFLDHYRQNLSRNSTLFAGIDDLLRALSRLDVRWGIVTNKPRLYTELLLKDLDLERRAAIVVCADDVPKAKPAPDSLLLACSRLAILPRQAIYVGDDKRDADAARAANMRFVAVRWGYEGEHPIASWNADATIASPSELLTHL
jgi:phosphoglycolate phosphatase